MSLISFGANSTGKCAFRSALLIRNSLKKEDKGRRDPTLKRSKKKQKKRRQPRRWRPEEINPFKEPLIADTSHLEASLDTTGINPNPVRYSTGGICAVPEIGVEDDDGSLEGWEETTTFREMMRTLERMERTGDDQDEDQDSDTLPADDEYDELSRDPGQMLEASGDLLDFEEGDDVTPVSDNEELADFADVEGIDLDLDERESKMFLRKIEELNPEHLFDANRDVVKEAERAIMAQRLKGIPRIPPNFDENDKFKWKDPYHQLCWDLTKLLFPKRGRRKYRQNRDHMNVSEEVKQKRAAKKARGYSIWLSMEIKKVLNETLRRTARVDGSEQRLQMIEKAMGKYSAFMKHQEHKFNLRNVIGMIHAIARLCSLTEQRQKLLRTNRSLLHALFRFVDEHITELNGRCICEFTWSVHAIGIDRLSTALEDSTGSETQQGGINVGALFHSVLERGVSESVSFNAQDCVILIRSLMLMELTEEYSSLMERLLEAVSEQIPQLTAHDASMLLWCLPRLAAELPPEFVSLLVARAVDLAPEFSPQGISVAVYGLARLRHYDCTQLTGRLMQEALNKLNTFKPQELANLVWGLAKLRHLPPPHFLNQVAAASIQKMNAFSLQEVSSLIMAYATFDYKQPSLSGAVRAKIVFSDGSQSSQDLTNIAWAFAILECLDVQFMQFILERLLQIDTELPLTEQLQIYQCFIHLSVHYPKSNVFQILPLGYLEECRLRWVDTQQQHASSAVMDDICAFLKRENYQCHEQHDIDGGAFQVTSIEANGVVFVVECLHPSVRFRNQPNTLTGKISWRENILSRMGYSMLRIDPIRWSWLETDEQKRDLFNRLL